MKNVTLRQLKVFEAVARNLSFSRAAAELHLTQPAVSMQVKLLEDSAGLPLFEQIGKKIFLTEAGREVQDHALAMAQQIREAEARLALLKGMEHGQLDISVISTAKYLAPHLLARFCREHPGIRLKLTVHNRESVLEQLARNTTDVAITGYPPKEMDIIAEPFAHNPHAFVAAPGHPLTRSHRIRLARIARENLLVREPGSGTRILMERIFAESRLTFAAAMEINSNETVKQAVMAGLGISLLSLHTIELELEAKRIAVLDVIGTPVVREWYLVHRTNKRLSPSAQAFKAFLLESAEPASERPPEKTVHM